MSNKLSHFHLLRSLQVLIATHMNNAIAFLSLPPFSVILPTIAKHSSDLSKGERTLMFRDFTIIRAWLQLSIYLLLRHGNINLSKLSFLICKMRNNNHTYFIGFVIRVKWDNACQEFSKMPHLLYHYLYFAKEHLRQCLLNSQQNPQSCPSAPSPSWTQGIVKALPPISTIYINITQILETLNHIMFPKCLPVFPLSIHFFFFKFQSFFLPRIPALNPLLSICSLQGRNDWLEFWNWKTLPGQTAAPL